jgi:hypothetical protein
LWGVRHFLACRRPRLNPLKRLDIRIAQSVDDAVTPCDRNRAGEPLPQGKSTHRQPIILSKGAAIMAITNVQTLPKDIDRVIDRHHNRPPVEVEAKAAFDELVDAIEKLRARINQFIVPIIGDDGQEVPFIKRVTVTSEETLGKAASTAKQILFESCHFRLGLLPSPFEPIDTAK